MQGGTTRRRVVSHFSTKIPLRRYFSGPAAVGYSLLFVSLLLTPYIMDFAHDIMIRAITLRLM